MTRDEIKLRAAKANMLRADAKYKAFMVKRGLAFENVRAAFHKRETVAYKALCLARHDQTRAELAHYGITPMRTIFIYRGKAYAVYIGSAGYGRMFPVTKKNKRHGGADDCSTPYRWGDVRITDRCLIVGDAQRPIRCQAARPSPHAGSLEMPDDVGLRPCGAV